MESPANHLDPRVKLAWRLQALAVVVPVLLIVTGGAILGVALRAPRSLTTGIPMLAVVLAAVLIWIVPEYVYRRWRWEVAEEEVRLREGLIIVTHTVIPMVRIQHVDTSQGPIMRAVGLSDVHISTAAGRHTIPALSDDHAAALRDRIATLARVTDDGGL